MAETKIDHEVLEPLKHSKKSYAKGDSVKLTADEAAPLIDLGVVKAPEAAKEDDSDLKNKK